MADVVKWTTAGISADINRIRGTDSTVPQYIAVGTDGTTATASDTALGAEVTRLAAKVPTNEGSGLMQWTDTYTNSSGSTKNIAEFGIFNASSGGVMNMRGTFTAIAVDNGESLALTINFTLGQFP